MMIAPNQDLGFLYKVTHFYLLWGAFGGLLAPLWVPPAGLQDQSLSGDGRGGVRGKGREGGKPPSQRDVGDVGRMGRRMMEDTVV